MSARFVGRARELGELRGAFDEALAGRTRLCLIAGEAGIGKTRLAEELARNASSRGTATVWGRCWEGEGAPAYWPWIQVLRGCVRLCTDEELRTALGPGAADVAELVPEVRERLPEVGIPTAIEPASARFRLFDSVTRYLAALSATRPLLLVLDDLHSADVASILLLHFLARELRDARLLLIGTFRRAGLSADDPRSTAFAGVAREGERLDLPGLGDDEIALVLEQTMGRRPAADVTRAVRERTNGNPLFVGELARLLATGVSLGVVDRSENAVPAGVRDVIRDRIARLPSACRDVLDVAAVIGRRFRLVVLAAAAGTSDADALARLEPAIAAEVIERDGRDDAWAFCHELVRDALYVELTPGARATWHRRVGEALESARGAGADVVEIAHHFFHAADVGGAERGVVYARRAAQKACEHFAYEQAVEQYERALMLLARAGSGGVAREGDLLLGFAEVLLQAGESERARATLERAIAVARATHDRDLLAGAAILSASRVRTGSGDAPTVALLEEALAALGDAASDARPRLLGHLANVLPRDQLARRTALAREAVDVARRVGDERALADTLETLHWTTWSPDNVGERLALASEMVALGERATDGRVAVRGHWLRVADRFEAGDVAGIEADVARVAALAESRRDPVARWLTCVYRGVQAILAGRFDDAERLVNETLVTGERAFPATAGQYFGAQLFALRHQQGRLDELEPIVRDLAARYPENPGWRAALAFLYSEIARFEQAKAELDALARHGLAEVQRDHDWLVTVVFASEVAAVVGDPRAATFYDLLAPFAGQNVAVSPGIAYIGPAHHSLGVLAGCLGRWDVAWGHFEEALAANVGMRALPFIAHTRREYGGALVRSGVDPERGRALLAGAIATYEALGMTSFAERTRAATGGARAGEAAVASIARDRPGRRGFVRHGDFWTLEYDRALLRLKDGKGLRYVAELLRNPGTAVHVLDLAAAVDGLPEARGALARDDDLTIGRPSAAADAPDAQARGEYRRRAQEIQEELDEAERLNDVGRRSRLRDELEAIGVELAAAYGLGAARRGNDAVERARKAVTNRIRSALKQIEDEPLQRHLTASLKLGTWCCYDPYPVVAWDLG